MSRPSSHWPIVSGAIFLSLAGLSSWWWFRHAPPPTPPTPEPQDFIPPSIIITEQSLPVVPAGSTAPGMPDIAAYAGAGGTDIEDMQLLARCAAAFLTIHKQAIDRPLSANGEWSAALRGQRPGTTRWFEDTAPLFSADGAIIDRHGTPVHFHALGRKSWEFRSAGPDKNLFTDDDAVSAVGQEKK